MYLSRSKMQGIPKKYSENFVDYFPPSKNGMARSESTQRLVVHSKPCIEKICIIYLLLRAWFIKSRDQTNARKNGSILIAFLINFNICFRETYLRNTIATCKRKPFVGLVSGFQPVTNVRKNSISGFVGVLDQCGQIKLQDCSLQPNHYVQLYSEYACETLYFTLRTENLITKLNYLV